MTGLITRQQPSGALVLQSAAKTAGNGSAQSLAGFNGARMLQLDNTDSAGTATVQLQGSFDGTNWFNVGYQQVDATAAPARSVTGISVAANTHHVYQVLDYYGWLRAVISSPSGFTSGGITATVYASPV